MAAANGYYSADEIRKRSSISTLVFNGYRPFCDESMQELVRHNIRRIELVESPDQYKLNDMRSMRIVDEICRRCGIEVAAYHAYRTTFNDVETEAQREERVDLCRRQIDTLLELGGTFWCSHAQGGEIEAKSYVDLARHIEGTPAVIAVENFDQDGARVDYRIKFLDQLDLPNVGMILDVCHEYTSDGTNPMSIAGEARATIEKCGRHLRHIHLQGFVNGDGHQPPLVEGDKLQWREIFEALAAIDYPGEFTFEPRGMLANLETLDYIGKAPDRLAALK